MLAKFNATRAGKIQHNYLGFMGSRKIRELPPGKGTALRGKKYSLVKNQFLGDATFVASEVVLRKNFSRVKLYLCISEHKS